jgi:hypothetical protein
MTRDDDRTARQIAHAVLATARLSSRSADEARPPRSRSCTDDDLRESSSALATSRRTSFAGVPSARSPRAAPVRSRRDRSRAREGSRIGNAEVQQFHLAERWRTS